MIWLRRFVRRIRALRSLASWQPADVRLRRLRLRVLWTSITRQPVSVRMRHEFNLWAENSRAEAMERDHRRFTEKTIERMDLRPGDRILDLACGEGWASRLLADRLGEHGRVIGVDISDGMVRHAQAKSAAFPNLRFLCGSAEHLPLPEGFFSKILCVEAFCYFEQQETVLRELLRLLAPEGRLFLVGCLYKEHPRSLALVRRLRVPVHARSMNEYREMLGSLGWADVETEEFLGSRPTDFHDRALLITARKPAPGGTQTADSATGHQKHSLAARMDA